MGPPKWVKKMDQNGTLVNGTEEQNSCVTLVSGTGILTVETPEHCNLLQGGVPLFWWKKPCFKWLQHVSFKEPCPNGLLSFWNSFSLNPQNGTLKEAQPPWPPQANFHNQSLSPKPLVSPKPYLGTRFYCWDWGGGGGGSFFGGPLTTFRVIGKAFSSPSIHYMLLTQWLPQTAQNHRMHWGLFWGKVPMREAHATDRNKSPMSRCSVYPHGHSLQLFKPAALSS